MYRLDPLAALFQRIMPFSMIFFKVGHPYPPKDARTRLDCSIYPILSCTTLNEAPKLDRFIECIYLVIQHRYFL